ncbi:hypothetical protein [Leeia aquatica]|uniref:Uncharacterized protein n=1 Tax=Leeia aquatica TaxID=2725557 RepID=A0A847SBA4_9NEIS|nr:hypothetical protein [Leeia aquatica]NLR74368.1 hypothetical protein [Leeia aquatica]
MGRNALRLLRPTVLAAFPLASFAQDGAALPAATEQQLDGLFAAWNHTDTPGAEGRAGGY